LNVTVMRAKRPRFITPASRSFCAMLIGERSRGATPSEMKGAIGERGARVGELNGERRVVPTGVSADQKSSPYVPPAHVS
jgi:hypothetical protein